MRKICIILSFCIFIFLHSVFIVKAEPIIVIDKGRKTITLKEEKVLVSYEAGFGLESSLYKEKKGDFLTPEGLYQIVNIRPSKEYKYFFELNYPNLNDLALAYYKGLIDKEKFIRLKEKLEELKPIKESILGGEIGIHGGGAFKWEKKNGKLYKNYNWTKGCIALNNEDISELLKYVKLGQKVYILNSQKRLYDFLKKFIYPTKIKPMEFFEGELYLKLDEHTYLNFHLLENYQGLKKLVIKKWVRGALEKKIESDETGNLSDEEEAYFKKLVIENLENLLKPYTELEL